MYFPVLEPKNWGKRSAAPPQTISSELPEVWIFRKKWERVTNTLLVPVCLFGKGKLFLDRIHTEQTFAEQFSGFIQHLDPDAGYRFAPVKNGSFRDDALGMGRAQKL